MDLLAWWREGSYADMCAARMFWISNNAGTVLCFLYAVAEEPDIEGTFAGGKIRYHRVSPSRIVSMLPSTAHIESVRPMSIFHRPFLDNIVTRFPFAYLIARMIVVTGRKY
jgi:hypothetical protein